MQLDFKNKTVLVTGGEGGLGKSICSKFLQLGAKVIVTTTKKKLVNKKSSRKIYMHLDYNNKGSIQNFLNNLKKIKKIDILINNAGINQLSYIHEIDEKYLEEIYKVNLRGPIIMTKQISKIMIKNKNGKIINISSIFGIVGKSGRSLYSVTKFGLIGLTKSSALDLAKHNILVNSVSPGVINAGLTKKILNSKELKKIKGEIPLNKLGEPSSVSYLICFLCSNLNTYITGQNFVIDGGYTSK
jgi:3-oxoacyl-[acyl-carrier protein] reductase